MNDNLSNEEIERLTALNNAAIKLCRNLEKVYMGAGGAELIEKSLGAVHAASAEMAVNSDISWTAVCENSKKIFPMG